jgi:hypothetical protein
MRDFHIYLVTDAGGACMTTVMDPSDPMRAEVLRAMSQTFQKAGRSREADECLHAINWRVE